jgi:hypothetical protein
MRIENSSTNYLNDLNHCHHFQLYIDRSCKVFAPMANNREWHDLNDNVPVVEIMATKMLAEAATSSAASTSAATRVKKAQSTPNGKL